VVRHLTGPLLFCCVLHPKPAQTTELPAYAVLSSAALGGIAYWLAIFPVDVIKSSMQTDSIIKSQRRYTSMITSAKVNGGFCVWAGGVLGATAGGVQPGCKGLVKGAGRVGF
jgi:hypothetical protein